MATTPPPCQPIDPAVTHRLSITHAVVAIDTILDYQPTHTFNESNVDEHTYKDIEKFIIDINSYNPNLLTSRNIELLDFANINGFNAKFMYCVSSLVRYITPPAPLVESTPVEAPDLNLNADVTLIVRVEYQGPDGSYSEVHYWPTTASGFPYLETDTPNHTTYRQVMLACYNNQKFKEFFFDRPWPKVPAAGDYHLLVGLIGLSWSVHGDYIFGDDNGNFHLYGYEVEPSWIAHTAYDTNRPYFFTHNWVIKTINLVVSNAIVKTTKLEPVPGLFKYTYELEITYENLGTYKDVPSGTFLSTWGGQYDDDNPWPIDNNQSISLPDSQETSQGWFLLDWYKYAGHHPTVNFTRLGWPDFHPYYS